MTTGQKATGPMKKKSPSQLRREKKQYMRRKRLRISVLRHGFSSREIQMGRAVARLKIEMGKKNPIDARIWIYAYSAFVDAIEILNQHNRMLRLEKRKEKSRLFLVNLRKTEVIQPKEEYKVIVYDGLASLPVMNYCEKCGTISIEVCKCGR